MFISNFYEAHPDFSTIGRTAESYNITTDYSVRFQTPDGLPHLSPEKIHYTDATDSSGYHGIDSLSTLFAFICQREYITNLHLKPDMHLIPDPEPNPFLEKIRNYIVYNASVSEPGSAPYDPNDFYGYEARVRTITEQVENDPEFCVVCNMQPVVDSINKSIGHITCDDNDAAIYVSLSGPNPAILVSSRNITDSNFKKQGNPIAMLYLYSTTSFGNDKTVINITNNTFIIPLTYYNIVKALLDLSFGCMNHRLSNVPTIRPFVK